MRQLFIADDGREFDSADECQQYEQMADIRNKIEAWAQAKHNDKKGQAARIVTGAVAWEAARAEVLSGML
jgi:molybdopterin biosynthesis enzyme